MKISFFEEYPNQESLKKLDLVDFPTKLFIATKELKRFLKLKEKLMQNSNIREVAWWPVVSKDDGYWLSPFTRKKALHNLIKDLDSCDEKLSILWDAEFPVLKSSLFFSEFFNFIPNMIKIKKFLKNTKHKVYSAEYPSFGFISSTWLKIWGLKLKNAIGIPMFYSSFLKSRFLRKLFFKKAKKENRKIVGLGCIGTGILGNEPILSPKQLENDLIDCKEAGIEEAVIFRLGGLNSDFAKKIRKVL